MELQKKKKYFKEEYKWTYSFKINKKFQFDSKNVCVRKHNENLLDCMEENSHIGEREEKKCFTQI